MVITVQQARSQLTQQQGVLTQARTQIEQTGLPQLTPEQLRGRTRADIISRQREQRRIESFKRKELGKVKEFETELGKFETQVGKAEQQLKEQQLLESDIRSAQKFADDNRFPFGESKRVRKLFNQIRSGIKVRERFQKQVEELEAKGLKPIILKGKITGFEDVLEKQSIELQTLLPTFTPLPETELPRLTIELPATRLEQLQKLIRESTPELKFIPEGDFKKGLQEIIGGGFGVEKFTRAKISGKVAQLRDIEGRTIFTPTQATKLTDLTLEVGESFALGAGVGKVATILRGAVLVALPKGLKESSKFKKVISTFDVVALGALTTQQALSISKTFREQGEDAAIIQAVGLVSFGAGFSKTGLKSIPQAEKEFKDLASTLKKAIPKGKKGELIRRRRKRKKGEIQALEQLSKEEADEARDLVGALEKRLLEAKTPKEQFKILAEIKKNLKTDVAKENFKELVLSLIEKDILKVPKVEIVPGVTVKEIPGVPVVAEFRRPLLKVREVGVPVGPAFGSLINRQRITKANILNKARVDISTIQKDIGIQRNKILTLTAQKASSSLLQQERLRLQNLQKERLRLMTKLGQVSKLKLTQVFKVKPRLPGFPRPKPIKKFIIPPPFILLKRKVKVKIPKGEFIKVPLKKGGYNVFVKSKGKFRKVNINPLTKKKAHDLGSWLVDRSTARTWKRKQVPFKAQKPILKVPTGYFKKTIIKYRGRKSKGIVQPLKNLGIEKRRFAIDTKSEKQQLSAARLRARLIKKIKVSFIPKLKATKLIKLK